MKLLQDRDKRDQERDNRFERACAIEIHMTISQEIFHARIYRESAAAQDCDAEFARACAVEMHRDLWQEPLHAPFDARIYKKNAGEQMDPLDLTQAKKLPPKEPLSVDTLLGEKDAEVSTNF